MVSKIPVSHNRYISSIIDTHWNWEKIYFFSLYKNLFKKYSLCWSQCTPRQCKINLLTQPLQFTALACEGGNALAQLYDRSLTHFCPPLRSTFAVRETHVSRHNGVGKNGLILRYFNTSIPAWKNLHRLSKRLWPLGVVDTRKRTPLNP